MAALFANKPNLGVNKSVVLCLCNVLNANDLYYVGFKRHLWKWHFNIIWVAFGPYKCHIYRWWMPHPSSANATQKMLKGYFHVIWGMRIGLSTHIFTAFNIIGRWRIRIYYLFHNFSRRLFCQYLSLELRWKNLCRNQEKNLESNSFLLSHLMIFNCLLQG